jgi:hypothetical protein
MITPEQRSKFFIDTNQSVCLAICLIELLGVRASILRHADVVELVRAENGRTD